MLKTETLFSKSDDYFDQLLVDIDHARASIDIETFIFSNDILSLRVATHLVKAASRGVKVRLMVDGAGALFGNTAIEKMLLAAKIDIRIYHPLPWRVWQWGHAVFLSKKFLTRLVYLVTCVNNRNHRKVVMIDGRIAWLGSANIVACHLSKNRGGDDWRDTIVRLENIELRDLILAFEAEFYGKHYQDLFHQPSYNPLIRLNNTRRRRRFFHYDLVRRICSAKNRIWITNAYFVPTEKLLRSLCHAAWRGIDVQIVLPERSTPVFMGWAAATFYGRLLKAGVKIYEYLPAMLHAKTLIIDNWMIVGSTNLNRRSLFFDFEVNVVLTTKKSKKILEQDFLIDKNNSQQVFWSGFHLGSSIKRFFGRIVLVLRYWL